MIDKKMSVFSAMSTESIESWISQDVLKGRKIVETVVEDLVGPGENFGGELLKLEVILEDETTKVRDVLHVAEKKIPVSEMFQKLFNVQTSFQAEINFYDKLVPIFQNFQRENNAKEIMDNFCQLYGYRLNLNGSKVVDRDAFILLENLTYSGFRNVNRYIGFTLEEAQLVLKNMAALHAVPLAIKLKKPEVFANEIRPLLTNDITQQNNNININIGSLLEDILWESDKCAPILSKVIGALKTAKTPQKYQPREPYATLSHTDLWVNNIMIKHQNGEPVACKFVDFQGYDYKSPAMDLLFFLLTSLQVDVLRDEFDILIKFYHKEFLNNLRELGCDVEPFNLLKFEEELATYALEVLQWCSGFILFIIYGPKEKPPVMEEPPPSFDPTGITFRDELRKMVRLEAKEKIQTIVQIYYRKNWLK
ncbi:unnamed protein product [Phyllotreta striolata]|uniref:CHK kinase-like domain-containing protein n=1 Tax=Phyllotreta striolata TaxID=444603 RepID=A0A9N9TI02_PHYSR|nr:unnamed protein product [Phyllotreta striolata]